jgi:hypothetical protein
VYTPQLLRPNNLLTTDLGLDIAAGREHSVVLFGSKVCPKNCAPDDVPKGDCLSVIGTCSCYTGFFGSDCSLFSCVDPICSGRGTCDSKVGECVCTTGFTGDSCQKRKCPNNCSGHGICDSTTGSCNCDSNYNVDDDCGTKNNSISFKFSISLTLIILFFLF